MEKQRKKQANFRLPEGLLEDLKSVSELSHNSQTEIVEKGISQKVARLKNKLGLHAKQVEVTGANG